MPPKGTQGGSPILHGHLTKRTYCPPRDRESVAHTHQQLCVGFLEVKLTREVLSTTSLTALQS